MALSPCHFRQAFSGEVDRFICLHPQVFTAGRIVHPGICMMCQYAQAVPATGMIDPLLRRVARNAPCVHLGDHIGERLCATCGGSVRSKVFRCRHPNHTETTILECQNCDDYVAPESVSR